MIGLFFLFLLSFFLFFFYIFGVALEEVDDDEDDIVDEVDDVAEDDAAGFDFDFGSLYGVKLESLSTPICPGLFRKNAVQSSSLLCAPSGSMNSASTL